jgi:uncharacterized protein involved in exopolysaccharide biosynthesis
MGAEPYREVRILDLATIVLRRWRLLAATTLVAVLLTGGFLLLQPARYKARTILVPAMEKGGGRSQILAQLPGGLSAMAGGAGDPRQNLIEAILGSRSLADAVVTRLTEEPGARRASEIEVRTILAQHTQVRSSLGDGSITVEVVARDPELSARIANAFPPIINDIATELGTQLAVQKERFLQAQLTTAGERLALAEQELLNFQQANGAPEVLEQARRTLDAAADAQQRVLQKEVEISQLRRTLTPDHPTLQAATAELNVMRAQAQRLMSGGAGGQIFIPLQESPELKVQTTRLLRDFTRNEQIYASLTAALADAQVEANNNLPVVGVLDEALVPTERTLSHAPILLAVAALLGLLLGLLLAFVSERLRGLRGEPENARFFEAWDQFKRDVSPSGGPRSRPEKRVPVPQ